MIKRMVARYALKKSIEYVEEMKHINALRAYGWIPKGSFMEERAKLHYAILELKIEVLMAFVPHNTEKLK